MKLFNFITNKMYKNSTYYKITKNSYFSTIKDVGKYGEYLTYKSLKHFENDGAKFLFNCYLPTNNNGTSELDVIMVHKSGIYVFESKNYSGWIFGNENDKMWTQVLKNNKNVHKEHFLNPIIQNKTHIKWLKNILNTNYPIYSIIVFSKRCKLKNININNEYLKVTKREYLKKIINKMSNTSLLNNEDIDKIYEILYPYTQVSELDKQKHIQNIYNKINQNEIICPKCGNTLVIRTTKTNNSKFYQS